jgi:hypothetical protein
MSASIGSGPGGNSFTGNPNNTNGSSATNYRPSMNGNAALHAYQGRGGNAPLSFSHRTFDLLRNSAMAADIPASESGPRIPALGGDKPTSPITRPVFVPSYLRGNAYARKLEAEYWSKTKPQNGSLVIGDGSARIPVTLSTSKPGRGSGDGLGHAIGNGSGTGDQSTETSHRDPLGRWLGRRGAHVEVAERSSKVGPLDKFLKLTPLPSRWNTGDCHPGLLLSEDGLELRYTVARPSSESEREVCSARADHYVNWQCGLYYYEIEVTSKRKDGYVYSIFPPPLGEGSSLLRCIPSVPFFNP